LKASAGAGSRVQKSRLRIHQEDPRTGLPLAATRTVVPMYSPAVTGDRAGGVHRCPHCTLLRHVSAPAAHNCGHWPQL